MVRQWTKQISLMSLIDRQMKSAVILSHCYLIWSDLIFLLTFIETLSVHACIYSCVSCQLRAFNAAMIFIIILLVNVVKASLAFLTVLPLNSALKTQAYHWSICRNHSITISKIFTGQHHNKASSAHNNVYTAACQDYDLCIFY